MTAKPRTAEKHWWVQEYFDLRVEAACSILFAEGRATSQTEALRQIALEWVKKSTDEQIKTRVKQIEATEMAEFP